MHTDRELNNGQKGRGLFTLVADQCYTEKWFWHFPQTFSKNFTNFCWNDIFIGFPIYFKWNLTEKRLEIFNFKQKKHQSSSSAFLMTTVKYTFSFVTTDVTGMAQWLKCPGKDDFVKQPNRVNHTIPMQFGVVVVFAILPYTMSWLPLSPEIRCRD